MTKVTDLGLFELATIGRRLVKVSHLQFVDDTFLMGAAKVENAWTIKHILRNMELLSGLKVNFEKCSLFGVNVEGDEGSWFRDRLERVIGDGKYILFWEDSWVGGEVLKIKSPRLFRLSRK
ncbi:hypothetical protein ACS0TY_006398 [Phlomoides rotata]